MSISLLHWGKIYNFASILKALQCKIAYVYSLSKTRGIRRSCNKFGKMMHKIKKELAWQPKPKSKYMQKYSNLQ